MPKLCIPSTASQYGHSINLIKKSNWVPVGAGPQPFSNLTANSKTGYR